MPPAQERESALFALALEKPLTERSAFLQAVCGKDNVLRQRLEALLAAHEQPDNLVPTQAEADRPTIKLDLADAPDEAVGQTLGRYKLLERVGEGGCGVVYVAEQTEPVRRRVALKVIKLGMDTRSDIYSLGVLLYELLAGSTPFDAKELMASGIDAMRKTIREKEPQRPSTRLATLGADQLPTTAKRRSADTSKLLHQLKGDLDWIVMKCLEKDRTRRYDTANGLAADLKRHLDNEPVTARPPSTAYRFQKLLRRNKVMSVATMLVLAAILVGTVVSIGQTLRARRELRRALAAEAQAQTEKANALVEKANAQAAFHQAAKAVETKGP